MITNRIKGKKEKDIFFRIGMGQMELDAVNSLMEDTQYEKYQRYVKKIVLEIQHLSEMMEAEINQE